MGCTSSELQHSSQPATGTPLWHQETPKGSRQGSVPAHTAGCSQAFPALHQSKPQTTSATPRGLDCLRPRHSKPPRAISRGKQDPLALPASTTTLSHFHPLSSVDSNLQSYFFVRAVCTSTLTTGLCILIYFVPLLQHSRPPPPSP